MDTLMESYNPFPVLSFDIHGNVIYLTPEVMLASQTPKKRAGRTKFKETRHPVYRGVRSRNSGKWVCEVRHPVTQSRVWLGTHPTADMAARAHDVAVLAMRGRSACLNFADSVWRLPVPESNDVRDIQKAAAEAAEAFRLSDTTPETTPETSPETECYGDEEEVYGWPEYIDSLDEALMVITPIQTAGHGNFFDDMDLFSVMSIWNS